MGAVAIIAVCLHRRPVARSALAAAALVAGACIALEPLRRRRGCWPYLPARRAAVVARASCPACTRPSPACGAAITIPIDVAGRARPCDLAASPARARAAALGRLSASCRCSASPMPGCRWPGSASSVLLEPLPLGIALGAVLRQAARHLRQHPAGGRAWDCAAAGGASWAQVYGVALLAGIGFTMSLFIGGLAFPGNAALMDEVKIGVLAGSILSAVMGFVLLYVAGSRSGGPDSIPAGRRSGLLTSCAASPRRATRSDALLLRSPPARPCAARRSCTMAASPIMPERPVRAEAIAETLGGSRRRPIMATRRSVRCMMPAISIS